MNQSQHEELAKLFEQHMQVSRQRAQQNEMLDSVTAQSEKQQQQEEKPIHFISSHYTGTAHVRPDTTSELSHSPPPPYNETPMPQAMAELLRQHAVDPFALLPNQIHLFQNADEEQRLRLLELCRIVAPSYLPEKHLKTETWVSTSVEPEELLARVRYEQQQKFQAMQYQEEHMLDTFIPKASSRPETRHSEAEPYMLNGYAAPSANAVDPVYAAAANLWAAPSYAHAVQSYQQHESSMEDQYGMYEQIRNHADWERMNERIARERLQGLQEQDYDMEL